MNADPTNPYVGLRPFDVKESILFFGRNDQILELLQRLHQHHFVAVVGSSGSGKSSLLRAGLIPSLIAGYLVEDSDHWVIAMMKPGKSPLYNLVESILQQLNFTVDASTITELVQKINEEGVYAILNLVTPLWKEQHVNFFLLVDQFEELFRFMLEQNDVSKYDEAIDFVNIILQLSKQQQLPFYIVIALRSDFIGDCSNFYDLPEVMNQSQYLVPRINRVQLKTVIEGPAKLYGGKIDPALSSRLLNDLGKVKDELPLLQHALMRMWDFETRTNNSNEIGLLDYESIGGIEKALSNHADEALAGLDEKELELAKKIFVSLTAIDENGRKIRRPALLSQLKELTGAGEEELLYIINLFIKDSRCFLVINKVGGSGDNLIDISHESLIRQWNTLCRWVDEEGESASNYLRLAESAELYKQDKKDLLTGSELQITSEWRDKFKPIAAWASRYKEGFEDSIEYLNKSELAQAAKLRIEQVRKRKQRNLRLAGIILLGILGIGAGITAWSFIKLNKEVGEKYLVSEASRVLDVNPTIALRLANEALSIHFDSADYKFEQGIYAENSFYKIVARRDKAISAVAFSPDATKILVGFVDNTVILYYLNGDSPHVFKGHSKRINAVAFSPDGKTILTGSADSTARLCNLNGDRLATFNGHKAAITSVAFSPNGYNILTGSADKSARLWDLKGNTVQEFSGHRDSINSVVFSTDGETILTGSSDNTARLWDLKGSMIKIFPHHKAPVTSVAFSPDGKSILTASGYEAHSWNLNGDSLHIFRGHLNKISSVAFSSDGKSILTSSWDDNIRLWDLNGNCIETMKGHTGWINSAVFSPDGRRVLSGASDGTARIWSFQRISLLKSIQQTDSVIAVAFSPDGRTILTGSTAKLAILWNMKGDSLQLFKGHSNRINSVSFTPHGDSILTGSDDSTARLWDMKGHILQTFRGHAGAVVSVAFSPDGKTILTGASDSTARLWNMEGKVLHTYYGHGSSIVSVCFSPDGKTMLTGSLDSTARLWDLNGALLQIFKGHIDVVNCIAFSPGGKTILTGSEDKTARLWDLKGNILKEFTGHVDAVNSVSFSRDGMRILTGSGDNTIRMWDLFGNSLQEFQGHFGHVNSVSFSPDGKTILTGSDDGSARIWKVEMPLEDFLKSGKIEPLSVDQKKLYGIK